MRKYDRESRLHYPSKPGGQLRLKMYLDESKGARLQNLWDDIPPLNSQAQERLGYPTQKPTALVQRIIAASSADGDVVLDPFCGCGTAIAASQKLGRRWIGIDITHVAIDIIKRRLADDFDLRSGHGYVVSGAPESLYDAASLAADDPYEFQAWIVGMLTGWPVVVKKGADRGIDGKVPFFDEPDGPAKAAIVQVRSGKVGPTAVRELAHVVTREKAQVGVLVTIDEPTRGMKIEAMEAGEYVSPWGRVRHPRIQLLTVQQILEGKRIDMPPGQGVGPTLPPPPSGKKRKGERQPRLPGVG